MILNLDYTYTFYIIVYCYAIYTKFKSHPLFYLYDMSLYKVIFYIRFVFVKDHTLMYNDSEVYTFNEYEVCYLIKRMDREFEVDAIKIWWKHEGGNLEDGLKQLMKV